ERDRPAAHVELAPLSQVDVVALVRSLASAATSDVALEALGSHAWQMAQGNPFMTIEMLRAAPDTPLPGKVADLVARRVGGLDDEARRIAAVAAIAGRDIEFDLVHVASGLDERDAADALERLIRRRVLRQSGERFDFIHDIVRQVVMRTLIAPQRRVLHRALGEALEKLRLVELDIDVTAAALHFRAGEAWSKALPYRRRAASQAHRRAAFREGLDFVEQALDSLGHLPNGPETNREYIDIVLDIYAMRLILGVADGDLADLRRAQSLAEAL